MLPFTPQLLYRPRKRIVAASSFSLAWTDSDTSTDDTGGDGGPVTYNKGGAHLSFGAADANRVIAVGFVSRIASDEVPTVTIGGVSATQVTGTAVNPSGAFKSSIWYAAVPTGTSGDVVISWTVEHFRSGIDVYRIITTTAAPTDGKNGSNSSGTSVSLGSSITVPSGGAAISIAGFRQPEVVTDIGWTNATGDHSDIQIGTFSTVGSAKSSSAGATAITAAISGATAGECVLSSAAWGP